MLKIKYIPNKLYPELSKIIIESINRKVIKFYSIIFSKKEEDRKDMLEITNHILGESEINSMVFNSHFYSFLDGFMEKFGEKFDCYVCYDPFEFECELSLRGCYIKPHLLLKTLKNSEERKTRKDKNQTYITTVKYNDTISWKIVFVCEKGTYKTKKLPQTEYSYEQVEKIRDEMIKEHGLGVKLVRAKY